MSSVNVKELADKYRTEFEEIYNRAFAYSLDLRKDLQETLKKVKENKQIYKEKAIAKSNEIIETIKNVNEPIKSLSNTKIPYTFLWIAIMQFVLLITSQISSYILYPFIGVLLGSFWSIVLAFVILPLFVYSQIKNTEEDERSTRFKLLTFASFEGLLTGFLFSNSYLNTIQPFGFLTSFAIAATSSNNSEKVSRTVLLGTALGSGLLSHLAVGLPVGQLSFSYFLLALLYTLIAFSALQIYIKETTEEKINKSDHLFMLQYVVANLIVQSIVLMLFGSDISSFEEINNPLTFEN